MKKILKKINFDISQGGFILVEVN